MFFFFLTDGGRIDMQVEKMKEIARLKAKEERKRLESEVREELYDCIHNYNFHIMP